MTIGVLFHVSVRDDDGGELDIGSANRTPLGIQASTGLLPLSKDICSGELVEIERLVGEK